MAPSTTTTHPTPPATYTAVVWRPCWHCALPLTTDEHDLCVPCTIDLAPITTGHLVAERDPGGRYLFEYHQLAGEALAAAIDHESDRLEQIAAAWAADHDLDAHQAAAYRGELRSIARPNLEDLAASETDAVGWARARVRAARWVEQLRVTQARRA